ncbi:hypothetical protein GQ55_2G116200 [Panicum hallii var. hallii]|uniref:Uncharacterized protein n=1 Tax=Panicum hallii var. hallii TaxID=1504633 RepID=A0A2T7ENX8_9POAL|nr:hypothetical protein GQ55_2G116200 [Panicum hallii var. hallii]
MQGLEFRSTAPSFLPPPPSPRESLPPLAAAAACHRRCLPPPSAARSSPPPPAAPSLARALDLCKERQVDATTAVVESDCQGGHLPGRREDAGLATRPRQPGPRQEQEGVLGQREATTPAAPCWSSSRPKRRPSELR